MNVFDLPGPEFLAVWLLGAVGVAVVTLVLRALLARPRDGDVEEIAKSLEPGDVAFLESDRERAIEAGVAGLVHRGVLEVVGGRVGLVSDKVIVSEGTYRGVVDNVPLTDVEQYIVDETRGSSASVSSLVSNAGELESRLRRKLEHEGLLVDRSANSWVLRAPALVWLVVGTMKLHMGITRDRPVGYLVLLLLAGAATTWMIKLPRLTTRAKRVLSYLRASSYSLESTVTTAPLMVSGGEMALAYALYGGAVAGACGPAMPSVQRSVVDQSTGSASGSSSCGSGGSSCSSGGSSCGGGGGGGCGGCGGGS